MSELQQKQQPPPKIREREEKNTHRERKLK